MATITPSIPTGYYMDHQTIRFSVSNDVTALATTQGGAPPSISKYIAYDTLNPPSPFLAVTEDGRGRVVYDGGFPKFYNNTSFNNATTFAELNGSCKFLHNAIHWVANQEKASRGIKKVLVLGDNYASSNYSPKSNRPDGFYSVLDMVARVAGYELIVKDLTDYGAMLNPTLSELEQYSLVILMGVLHASSPLITQQAVNAMVSFRENGNGIIMITDHGPFYTNINDAAVGGGFFSTTNAVAARFGAYFTGDYNRVPVNVGFLRNTYGNHPLYNNLSDDDNIIAGGSESRVEVTSDPTYSPSQLPAQTTTVNGINYINVMAILNDGSIVSARFTYIIAGDEVLFVNSNINGAPTTNNGVGVDAAGGLSLGVTTDGSALGTMWGEIFLNGVRIGAYHEESGVKQFSLYANTQARAKKGDVIEVRNSIPFTYSKSFTVTGNDNNLSAILAESRISKLLAPETGGSTLKAVAVKFNAVKQASGGSFVCLDKSSRIKVIKSARIGKLASTQDLPVAIQLSDADAAAAVSASTKPMLNHAINGQTGMIIAWKDGAVRNTNVHVRDVYPPMQKLISNGVAGTWQINAAGNLVKIA